MANLDIYGQPQGQGESWPAIRRALQDLTGRVSFAVQNPGEYAGMLGRKIVESGRTARELQNQAFADPRQPFKITDENALRQLTDMMMAGPLGFAPVGITAYHGSPYLFKQFDPMKVGTGEGAQAYGVGAGYTAEARPVAESYRASVAAQKRSAGQDIGEVTIGGKPINWDKPEEVAAFELSRHAGDRKAAADFHARTFMGGEENPAVKLLRSNKELPQVDLPGYLYKGDIPDEILPKFLDWDKKLKDQSEDIQQVAKKLLPKLKSVNPDINLDNMTGEGLYRSYQAYRGNQPDFASEGLEAMGIRGIRYLDQGSRGADGNLTSNFIPFNPKDFNIQEINDMPIQDWISKGLLAP